MIITGGVVISGGVRMTPLVAPSVPTITSVVMTDIDVASITFTASSNNGGLPIRSYTAYSIPPGATGTINTSGSGAVTVTGLSSSTFYRFGLYASNLIGDGGSTVSNIILPFTWGSAEYTIPGLYTWFAPNPYITSVSVLAIGGGGAGKTSSGSTVSGGQGGASNFVSSGIIQASGGTNANSSGSGNFGGGGGAGTGTTGVVVFVGGSGGGGVACATGGGGGAAGYAGNGGSGAASGSIASAGSGGGGGGGGVVTAGFGAGGGGVGIYGRGTNGNGGVNSPTLGGGGGGGSGGSAGTSTVVSGTPGGGGRFGGGGGGGAAGGGAGLAYLNTVAVAFGQGYNITVGAGGVASGTALANGAGGAVRIVYPAQSRVFPSTNVGSCASIVDLNSYSTPSIITATSVSSSIPANGVFTATISVSTPLSNGGLPIYKYTVVLPRLGIERSILTATGTTFVLNNLPFSTTSYIASVSASNIIGDSTPTIISIDGPVAPTSIEYLIVAGGGGGGGHFGGGGGAGGLLSGTVSPSSGISYNVVVGSGGSAGPAFPSSARGGNGNQSSFSLIATTVVGGGGGGTRTNCGAGTSGRPGGSGGGGGNENGVAAGLGTAGQGNAGGSGFNNGGNSAGGGGGGAVGTGGAAGNLTGGAGGTGLTSSISGSSVTYARGGSGASGTVRGTTGGGANTGGGGAGGQSCGGGGDAGSSGVVIIRYPESFLPPASTTGNPTVTVTGGFRIYSFTSSGSITF